MYSVVVNCEKLPFGKTLGVSHLLIQLCSALAQKCELVFAIKDIDDFESSDVRSIVETYASDIVPFSKASQTQIFRKAGFIELLPHHFQESKLASKSVMICHDLHIFDIGWKYNNVEVLREAFKANIRNVGAVVAHFPRTYYSLEKIAGTFKKELFLTESPLLLDTRPAGAPINGAVSGSKEVVELLYPAQLQEHKNHQILIEAVAELKKKGRRVRILCSGSSFNNTLTEKLTSLIKQNGVETEINFIGRISDDELRQLYWRCDGVIVPSLAEGGAYVALEAIAALKPVALNRIDSAQQHIRSIGGEVIWFDAMNARSTQDALEKLIDAEPEAWLTANSMARQRIDQMTWEKVAEKWFVILEWLSGATDRPVVSVDRDGWNVAVKAP
jgi:glycosyltransferase involved in cell wall biosynthesis